MAKRRYAMTEGKITRFKRERRGQGAGGNYKPWLTVYDVPSLGRSHRPLGMKTGRTHHLLSDLEYRGFLDADFDQQVVDVREQFPLCRDETRRLASLLEVRHPRDPKTGVDIVMTTDLVVYRQVGLDVDVEPIFVKYAGDLEKPSVIDKLEIERRYWAARGHFLQVRTELELPKVRGEVIAWIAANYWLHEQPWPSPGYWMKRSKAFLAALAVTDCVTFEQFDGELREGGFMVGEAIACLRHVLAHHVLELDDLEKPFSQADLLSRFRFP